MARETTAKRLDFPEKLIQTGKKENTDALLKRLKTLHLKLRALEQDGTDLRSLDPIKKPLTNDVILHHKDRGIKAYAACCLADLLRLVAPDAPYTGDELRDIFQFFSTQITLNLKTTPSTVKPLQPSRSKTNEASQSQPSAAASQRITDIPYYAEYFYLLESLSTIKSIVLACDVPGGDDIVVGFFDGFVDIVRSDMSKNLLRFFIDILVTLLEESSAIPAGVLDCVVGQFENKGADTETPAFQLIVDVCNRCPSRLQRPMYAHFSDIQLEHGKSPSESDIKILAASHALMLTMYRHCPNIMINVVQQLEDNLRAVDEIPLRQLSTRTLGTMFGMRPIVGSDVADLARAYPNAWRAWLGRRVDKALPVRLAWVEAAKGILNNHPELRAELEVALVDRILDSDEKVRAAICKAIGSLDYETALHHISVDTLKAVGGRLNDRKSSVRGEAANALAKLWTLSLSEIDAGDPEAIRQFAWIPQTILHSFSPEAPLELRMQMISTLKTQILPLPKAEGLDEQAWVDRLLLVAADLDEQAYKALERLTGLKGYAKGGSPFKSFIRFCEDNNGGIIDGTDEEVKMVKDRLAIVINAVATKLFVEADKARKDIETFAEANDARLYKLFRTCVDEQSDLKTIIKARAEFERRIQQSHTEILETFTTIIDFAAWNIINHSSIPPLLKRLQRPEGTNKDCVADAAYRLLASMAKEAAPMFKSHMAELAIVIGEKKNAKLAEIGIRALASVVKADSEMPPQDKRLVEKAIKMALQGTPRQAKFAARFVAFSKNKEAPAELIETILGELSNDDQTRLLTLLRALSELAISAPAAFEARSEDVIRFVMYEVMLKRSPSHEDAVVDEWVEEAELEILDRAKLLGLRIITHRSLAFCRDPNAIALARPSFELLEQVLTNDGMVNETTMEGGHARAHLKLRAGLCALKLANSKAYDRAMSAEFFELVAFNLYAQEKVAQVRGGMLAKLAEVLPAQRLQPRWNILPHLIAVDPEPEHQTTAKAVVHALVRVCAGLPTAERIDRVELPFTRLLLVLSHIEDTDFSAEGMQDLARHIEFFLDRIAHRDNIGLLYHLAAKLKTVVDLKVEDKDREAFVLDPESPKSEKEQRNDRLLAMKSANLYRTAELAQMIIQNRARAHGWSNSAYPGKVRLPKDVFHNLKDNVEAQEVSRFTFLSEDVASLLKGHGRRAAASSAQKRGKPEGGSPTKKRVKSQKKTPRKKRRSGRERDEEDDDEHAEDEDEEEEEEASDAAESDVEANTSEVEGGVAVIGRGGRRGAKSKARRAVTKKSRRVKKDEEMEVDGGEESELTDLGES